MQAKTPISRLLRFSIASFLFAFAAAALGDHHEKGKKDKDHELIEYVMNDIHKGKSSTLQKIIKGEASKKQVRDVIRHYIAMEDTKAPVGDQDNWKKLTVNLSNAAIDFYVGKDGSVDALKKAVHCKTCHNAHKPQD